MNVVAISLTMYLPWLLYCAVFSICSFGIRFSNPLVYWAIMLVAVSFVVLCGAVAFQSYRRKLTDEMHQPTWYVILFLASLLALVLALLGGVAIFSQNYSAFNDLWNLNDMSNVDPARMRGQQMMDVGRATFVNGTHLDLKLAMGFMNDDVYCVAPITSMQTPLKVYDFWAVGKNCCSGSPGSFRCANFDNPSAKAGLRVTTDGPRAFYRLAVQQAQANFQIRAEHPLFFHWVEDAASEQTLALTVCWRSYVLGVLAHFFLQFAIVLVASLCFLNNDGVRKTFG